MINDLKAQLKEVCLKPPGMALTVSAFFRFVYATYVGAVPYSADRYA